MFTIVGERINCTRTSIRAATEHRDAAVIRREAVQQAAAGATYIDVNAGISPERELDDMRWLLAEVQAAVPTPISIDSANPEVIAAGLAALDGRPALVNSISLQHGAADRLLPLIAGSGAAVIALCLGPTGLPETAEDRCVLAEGLLAKTRGAGIPDERVFIDPGVRAVAAEDKQPAAFLHAIRLIRTAAPAVHFCAGVSNVSFGLPQRSVLNRTMLALSIWEGLDGALIDPTHPQVMAELYAARALAGLDEYCMEYVAFARETLGA